MDKLIVMGPQGSGKGTLARRLKEARGLVHISVGDILRWNIQSHTKLGSRIRRTIAAGELVPDEVVDELVHQRLDQHDWNYGFILDGFPRTRAQADFLLEHYHVDATIYIDVPDGVVFERMLARRVCARCGLDYNLIAHRPAVADTCDVCGGELVPREDDTPDAIRRRLAEYHALTVPVLQRLRERRPVLVVDGTVAPEEVYARVRAALDAALPAPVDSGEAGTAPDPALPVG